MHSGEQTLHLQLSVFFSIVKLICPGAQASVDTKSKGNLDSAMAYFISLCIETSTWLPCVTQLLGQEVLAVTAGRHIYSSEIRHPDQVIFSNASEPRIIWLIAQYYCETHGYIPRALLRLSVHGGCARGSVQDRCTISVFIWQCRVMNQRSLTQQRYL